MQKIVFKQWGPVCICVLALWLIASHTFANDIHPKVQTEQVIIEPAPTYQADTLFQRFSQSVFQVNIINVKSKSQASIGSGFIVGDGSLLATNFHVISSLVDKPQQYRAQIVQGDQSVVLTLVAFDVVHDLAILKVANGSNEENTENIKSKMLGEPLALASTALLNKGTTLYSIGNPHDIGMTVIQGAYNGLVEHRFVESIHFSGAINSGMSGGPTINERGAVVGINVASSGNQIGFLVPVDRLQRLLARHTELTPKDYQRAMSEQITAFSDQMMASLMSNSWPSDTMGKAQVVGKISDRIECWGNSDIQKKFGLTSISKGCRNQDRIYIHRQLDMGQMEYEYHYYDANEWNTLAFYRFMEEKITGARGINRVNKESVNNYHCKTDIINTKKVGVEDGQSIDNSSDTLHKKVNYCVRSYKKIPNLYDVFYLATTIDKNNVAMLEHYTFSGVTQVSADQFLQRFIGTLSWELPRELPRESSWR